MRMSSVPVVHLATRFGPHLGQDDLVDAVLAISVWCQGGVIITYLNVLNVTVL